eukprot:7355270-Pyramimonas_sp.AAC.1
MLVVRLASNPPPLRASRMLIRRVAVPSLGHELLLWFLQGLANIHGATPLRLDVGASAAACSAAIALAVGLALDLALDPGLAD